MVRDKARHLLTEEGAQFYISLSVRWFMSSGRTEPLFDVSADGQRFAVLTGDRTKTTTITLLTNCPAEVKK